MLLLGFVLMIAGFYKSLTNKNAVSDKTKADKPYKDLAVAMLVIGFVLCFITFIISVATGIHMF
jgi:ABC-type Fe3+ transport system permease subunit